MAGQEGPTSSEKAHPPIQGGMSGVPVAGSPIGMTRLRDHHLLKTFLADYGMVLVLALLCAFFGVVTCTEQHPTGAQAARRLASDIEAATGGRGRVLIVVREGADDAAFAAE